MKRDQIRIELLALQQKSKDGMLYPKRVVAWAKANPKSALHRQFTWDDSKAAAEYRLWQARRIIKVVIIDESQEPTVVSLSIDRQRGGGYRSVDNVIGSKELCAVMLRDAIGELQRVRERYQHVRQLTSVWAELDKIRADVEKPPKIRNAA